MGWEKRKINFWVIFAKTGVGVVKLRLLVDFVLFGLFYMVMRHWIFLLMVYLILMHMAIIAVVVDTQEAIALRKCAPSAFI
jgi:hypothetical protein